MGGRADGERLPRRVRHRVRPDARCRHRRHRPGHRRLARGRGGGRAPRLGHESSTNWPARSWPGTCSSAGRRRPAATSAVPVAPRTTGQPLGFPLAEIAADGSCVITKHDGTGGAVTVDTVTAQLVYEIQSTRYLGPDVTTHLDSITLAQDGAGSGRDHRHPRLAAAGAAQGLRQRARWIPQQRGVRADRARHRGQGRLGAIAAGPRADDRPRPRSSGRGSPCRPPTPTRRRARPRSCAARSRTPRRTRSAGRSPPPPSSSRSGPTPASP